MTPAQEALWALMKHCETCRTCTDAQPCPTGTGLSEAAVPLVRAEREAREAAE